MSNNYFYWVLFVVKKKTKVWIRNIFIFKFLTKETGHISELIISWISKGIRGPADVNIKKLNVK